jgi:hypothetical protein
MKIKSFIIGLLALIVLGVTITGCKKEPVDCSCGIITQDYIEGGIYYLEVQNECTNNKQWFSVSRDVWINGFIGSEQCFTSPSRW